MIREIRELGDPTLRLRAADVSNLMSAAVSEIIRDLFDTMNHSNGVGIAAPQIGESLRIFIVASRPNERYPHAPVMEPKVVVNPEIISVSDTTEKGWEGCLSIPGIRGLVPRPTHIRVRYTDLQTGEQIETELRDFVARVWLHEYDHLEGIVFLDRLESTRDIITTRELQRRDFKS
jgi:peptide deformylase